MIIFLFYPILLKGLSWSRDHIIDHMTIDETFHSEGHRKLVLWQT